jgi:hypothetical protein
MHAHQPLPACAQCGRNEVKVIAEKLDYLPGSRSWNSPSSATTFTYQCSCGAAFTHTVHNELRPNERNDS